MSSPVVRHRELFDKIDKNKNSNLSIEEIRSVFKSCSDEVIDQLVGKGDRDELRITFDQFSEILQNQEEKLNSIFKSIDKNNDGEISFNELIKSLIENNIEMTPKEVKNLIKKADKNGNMRLSFDEFRDYFLFSPVNSNLVDLMNYWNHPVIIDTGDHDCIAKDFDKNDLETGVWWRNLIAGGIAGAVSRTCTAPLDRIKVILQVYGGSKDIKFISGLAYLQKEGGFLALWRGNGVNITKIVPESAIKFMVYEQIKKVIREYKEREELKVYEKFVAGSCAGAVAQTAIYPMEVIKTRLCLAKTGEISTIFQCASQILQREGIRSFYRGYVPNLLGILPYAGTELALYETFKGMVRKNFASGESGMPPDWVLLACGGASSACGQLLTYPLALVKTKLQATGSSKHSGMTDIFAETLKREGFMGLYRGITPNFLKVLPSVSLSYMLYEKTREALGLPSSS